MRNLSSDQTIYTIIFQTPRGKYRSFTGLGNQVAFVERTNAIANLGNNIIVLEQHYTRPSFLKEEFRRIRKEARLTASKYACTATTGKPKLIFCRHLDHKCREYVYAMA